MGEVSIIVLDLAKNVFQAHGAGSDGSVVFRRKLSRTASEVPGRTATLRGGDGGLRQFASLGAGDQRSRP